MGSEMCIRDSPYPNPQIRGKTVNIRYSLSNPARMTLKIYTLTGELLYRDTWEAQSGDDQKREWKTTNQNQQVIGRGIYIYVLQAEKEDGNVLQAIKRMVVTDD